MLSDSQVKDCADKALIEFGASFAAWRCERARYKLPRWSWLFPGNPDEGGRPPFLELRFINSTGKRRGVKWPIRNEDPTVIKEGLKAILIRTKARRG
jgi:hypothetical protein